MITTNALHKLDYTFSDATRVVFVQTEWNHHIVNQLYVKGQETLISYGVKHIERIVVPGAVEIPFAIKHYADHIAQKPHAFIALGCVIKGETPHFDYVCHMVSSGINTLNLTLHIPTIFGILTVNTLDQAQARINDPEHHKGIEFALSALKMIHLVDSLHQK